MDPVTGVPAVLSPLEVWAAQTHEAFVALQAAGFAEHQALSLLAGMQQPGSADRQD
jgi:hypothetical protein